MNKIKPQLSAVIITKNEEKKIKDCINSVFFADEIIVIDSRSSDRTIAIVKSFGEKVVTYESDFKDFATQKNFALSKAKNDWVLFVDADERISVDLKEEIQNALAQKKFSAFSIRRKNFFFGFYQWPEIEKMERLFLKKKLEGWSGSLHESPKYEGELGELNNFLLHYTHDDLFSMVEKSNQWSEIEAETIFNSNHPKMAWWRFIHVMLIKFFDSFIRKKGYQLGTVGFIESIYQAFSYFITYAKLWEKQNKR